MRASDLRTSAPASAGASVGGRRRATDRGRNICWKGRCTAGQVTAGRRRSTTMKNRIREIKTKGRLRYGVEEMAFGGFVCVHLPRYDRCRRPDRELQSGNCRSTQESGTRQLDALSPDL